MHQLVYFAEPSTLYFPFYNLLLHVVSFQFGEVGSKSHFQHECSDIRVGFPTKKKNVFIVYVKFS